MRGTSRNRIVLAGARALAFVAFVALVAGGCGRGDRAPPSPFRTADAATYAPPFATASKLPPSPAIAVETPRVARTAVTLAPADVAPQAGLGSSLDVDDAVILAGAPGISFAEGVVGTAHVFEKVGASWQRTAKLVSPSKQAGFGDDVAIDGARAAVTSHGGDIVVFERAGKAWKPTATITPPTKDGRPEYSPSLDLDGDTLVVGLSDQDRVVIYVRGTGGTWTEHGTLTASDGAERAARGEQPQFGWKVAVRGDALAVSSRQAPCSGGTEMCGAAYLFRRGADGVWSEEQRLPLHELVRWAVLGWSLALDGNDVALLVDGERRGWMLARSGAGWGETGTIDLPPKAGDARTSSTIAVGGGYAALSEFGVPTLGQPPVVPGTRDLDLAALGAQRGAGGGMIHVFGRTATGWVSHGTLTSPDDTSGSELGRTLAISGPLVVAGAPHARGDRGAVVVFEP